ncbi:MAG: N-acetylmuramoyl-L-alanine amidase [Phycisphaerales bacterium]|nr:MAG: N-acetylmuramoyl-L-alanine amidase [Phycisphaerales bacterium]
MKRAAPVTLAALLLAASGCASPSVIRRLPDPTITPPRPRISRAPVATPRPPPRPPPSTPLAGKVIVVDAGHGGHDPGALGVGPVPEETVNLGVALKLIPFLEQRGAQVIATRTGDRFVALDGRARMAEEARADLFVSIHADACPRSSVSGATIYVARGAGGASRRAAGSIAAALESSGIACRGVRKAGFRVLVGHSRPAVLIECGYLTNYHEARALGTSAYQARLAEAIAEGITDHFGP